MNTINNTAKAFLDFKVTMHRSGKISIIMSIFRDTFSFLKNDINAGR